ncbi:MAG: hypothetical protein SV186_07170, partial [Candidatus Nanohaloarchaea archaeon]|nr:hypothetical protein [Candidatus Nanohaloarchaea archaeon]
MADDEEVEEAVEKKESTFQWVGDSETYEDETIDLAEPETTDEGDERGYEDRKRSFLEAVDHYVSARKNPNTGQSMRNHKRRSTSGTSMSEFEQKIEKRAKYLGGELEDHGDAVKQYGRRLKDDLSNDDYESAVEDIAAIYKATGDDDLRDSLMGKVKDLYEHE